MHPELVRVLNAIRIPIRPLVQLEPSPRQLEARRDGRLLRAQGAGHPLLADELAQLIDG
jgi:hypothetical protein